MIDPNARKENLTDDLRSLQHDPAPLSQDTKPTIDFWAGSLFGPSLGGLMYAFFLIFGGGTLVNEVFPATAVVGGSVHPNSGQWNAAKEVVAFFLPIVLPILSYVLYLFVLLPVAAILDSHKSYSLVTLVACTALPVALLCPFLFGGADIQEYAKAAAHGFIWMGFISASFWYWSRY